MISTPGKRMDIAAQKSPDARPSPRQVLSAFEDQMKRKVKQFDLRVLKNKRQLEKIRGHLSVYLDDCQKALENRLVDLDTRIERLADRVGAWEKRLDHEQSLKHGAEV